MLYHILWIFFIYAFLGWCTEVSYAATKTGRFVNRGFLNGPWCPIYGLGVVIVLAFLDPLKNNLLLLFLGSVVLTSALEWLTGFLLEHDMTVYLVIFDRTACTISGKLFDRIAAYIDDNYVDSHTDEQEQRRRELLFRREAAPQREDEAWQYARELHRDRG